LIEAAYYSGQEQYEKQVQALQALVNQYPDDVEARYRLALAYDSVADHTKAIEQARIVVKADPYTRAYGFLVMQLARNNQNAEAVEVYGQGAKLFPDDPQLKVGLGLAKLGEGDVTAARAAFSQLNGTSYQWWGQVFLARAAMYEGKFNEAQQVLEEQLKADHKAENPTAMLLERYLLASIYLVKEKPMQARQQVDANLAMGGPEALQAEDFRHAGTVYAQTGDLVTARGVLETLDRLRIDFSGAINLSCYYNLAGEIALAAGRPDAAVAAFGAALQARPRAISHAGMGMAQAKLGNWGQAAEEWKIVLGSRGELLYESTPLDWQIAYLQVGRAEWKLNQVQNAKQDYESFLRLWPNGDNVPLRAQALAEYHQMFGPGDPLQDGKQ
jgi:tetratricopeptide (TPR) repeat protein